MDLPNDIKEVVPNSMSMQRAQTTSIADEQCSTALKHAGGFSTLMNRVTQSCDSFLRRLHSSARNPGSFRSDSAHLPLNNRSIALRIGNRQLHCYPDVGVSSGYGDKTLNYNVLDPDNYFDGLGHSVCLRPGDKIAVSLNAAVTERLLSPDATASAPQLQICHRGSHLQLEQPAGTEKVVASILTDVNLMPRLIRDRRDALSQVVGIAGGSLSVRPPDEALSLLHSVNAQMRHAPYRPLDTDGLPGSLVELPDHLAPIVIGDLHGRVDNLLKILCENGVMTELSRGKAALVFLGDAVHGDDCDSLRSMESSVLVMDLIFALKLAFPQQVFFLLGNHDCFSPDLIKGGVPQGLLWRQHLQDLRGESYCLALQQFYDRSPVVALSKDLVMCHAGPPRKRISRQVLINLKNFPQFKHELVWNRMRSPSCPDGYDAADVRRFRKSLALADELTFLVGHSPLSDTETIWLNVGSIREHHVVYSARRDRVGVFVRVGGAIVAQVFTAEPILEWLNDGGDSALCDNDALPVQAMAKNPLVPCPV